MRFHNKNLNFLKLLTVTLYKHTKMPTIQMKTAIFRKTLKKKLLKGKKLEANS